MQWLLLALVLLRFLCVDGSSQETTSCEPPNFKCKNSNHCILHSLVCDGDNDCDDKSDEENCDSKKFTTTKDQCGAHEFECKDGFHCIPLSEFCDGKHDCIDESDEENDCHRYKDCEGFRCAKDGQCIEQHWMCDGKADCADDSDEADCDKPPIAPAACNNTIGKFLCKNERCIPLSVTCDGKDNCGDESDEQPKCAPQTICTGNDSPCPATISCAVTPKGHQCFCPDGHVLKNNSVCEDIDECQDTKICSQGCRNTPGSYFCICEDGFKLQDDRRSCKAENGEALLVYTTKTSIVGYYLDSHIYYKIAENLQHVVGVSIDSKYIYWSDIDIGEEAIFRSFDNGTDRKVIVNAGLGSAEDIAVDWVTGNVYFTDSVYKHIGVCNEDGAYCTVIIKESMEKPRGIALLPSDGKMFWSDWGRNAHISVADMDGKNRAHFVTKDIEWPNGITIDYPSRRLYWVDAKRKAIESILLNGSDRKRIFQQESYHPYSIGIFENRMYWTDWITNSILACDKFTGKDFATLTKANETVYGIHIYHSALKAKYSNPCQSRQCSQLCLLAANRTYSCACTLDKELNVDRHTCKDSVKRKHIAIAAGNIIVDYFHELLGRPKMTATTTMNHITAITYDSLTDTIIAADELKKSIFRYNPHTGSINHLIQIVDEIVESIAFDPYSNNLYKSNTLQKKIEVHSLTTGEKTEFFYTEKPYDLLIVPELGLMFVVFRSRDEFHIDKVQMNGLGPRTHLIEHDLIGPKISLAYDDATDETNKRIYWSDEGSGRIESMDIQGQNRILFMTGIRGPMSLTILEGDIFWTKHKSNQLYWADKEMRITGTKKLTLFDIANDTDIIYLQTISGISTQHKHECLRNNGLCSHICLVKDLHEKLCACPQGFLINYDQKTCRPKTLCTDSEIRCEKSDKCISIIQKCNGVKECPLGDDEKNCPAALTTCQPDEFMCKNGECIPKRNQCDSNIHCTDQSDEENCDNSTIICTRDEFRCYDGNCIKKSKVCNGYNDCEDFSDEQDCNENTCDELSFKCNSGLCIPRNWECDGDVDCPDGTDEHSLCKHSDCAQNMFSCKNGGCIDELLKCNNMDDCNDNSDEENCKDSVGSDALVCLSNQYKCFASNLCIDQKLKCNGNFDCPNHDDEHNCSECIRKIHFTCSNTKCIPLEWVCDQADDCGDNSDEINCEHLKLGPVTTGISSNCSEGQFTCKSGLCLPLENACDGEEHCTDGSDEGGDCNDACKVNICENLCHKTPTGPVCSCLDGYKLSMNGKTCDDIDECQGNTCAQICINRQGTYACSCFDGYALRSNYRSCKATGPVAKIITATNDDIRVMSLISQRKSIIIVHQDPGIEINGLDVNAAENTVYWSTETVGAINKMNIDTKQHVSITEGVGRPETLALDWISNNVYFFDNKQNPSIKICNIDEKKCAKIIHIEGSHNKVTAIAVEPKKGFLFWSLVMWKLYAKSTSEIVRSDLLGGDRKVIVHENLGIVSGLTIDHQRSLLYWSDNSEKNIECVDFNGNNRKGIVADIVPKPIGLTFYEDALYWKTEANGAIRSYQLYGDMAYELIHIGNNNLNRLFVISQISRQPAGENKCKDRGCEHLCVIHLDIPTCICGNGFPANLNDGMACSPDSQIVDEKISLEEDGSRGWFYDAPMVSRAQQQPGRQSTGAFTGFVITLVTFVLMFSVYFYLKKKRPGLFKPRDLSIRFQNPSFSRGNNNSSMTSTSSILMPGEHEYSNPITEMTDSKPTVTDSASTKKRLELTVESPELEQEEPTNTNYQTRLIH